MKGNRGSFAWFDWWKKQQEEKRKPVLAELDAPKPRPDGGFFLGVAVACAFTAALLALVAWAFGWLT
ncbi:MAG: hypothetical protein E4H01_10940 [Lysobacterales bacterium]|nr:MAG: hypothetical protein E4H01_10940 [Xanthomonadales bacterium]